MYASNDKVWGTHHVRKNLYNERNSKTTAKTYLEQEADFLCLGKELYVI
jgi:hypothetical protein